MPFKPNYNHQRAERNRAKEQKKLEKRQRREDEASRRRTELDSAVENGAGGAAPANPSEDAIGSQETEN